MNEPLRYFLPLTYIESVNKHLRPMISKKKLILCLHPDCVRAKKDYARKLQEYAQIPEGYECTWANIELVIGYYMKSSFYKRDLNNFHKILIDSIATHFGFNDAMIVNEHFYKRFLSDSEMEYIYIKLTPMAKTKAELIVKKTDFPSKN